MNIVQNIYFFSSVCTVSYARHFFYAHSLLPYIRSGRELSDEVPRLNMIDLSCTLPNTDKRYVQTLFDFSGTCGMNLLDLLRKEEKTEIRW